ncbi:MAG: SH3 domain-containing protein [Lachnospiraceae bacterium]|nr:SH3 domain-containing protein [Lachnospiraceae bacterium]
MKTKTSRVTRILGVVMMLVLTLGLSMIAYATAKEGDTVRVKGDAANVRSDAGTNYAIVCEINNTVDLKVTGSKQGADGSTWYAISFEVGGEAKTGYIRSDLVTVTASGAVEEPEPEEPEPQEPQDTGAAGSDYSFSTINPMMTDEVPSAIPAGFSEIKISANGQETPAWTDGEFFLMYATSPTGSVGWYIWDEKENSYMRYASFMQPVTVSSDNANAETTADTKTEGIAKPIFFIFVGITVVLIVITAIMGFKLLNRGSSYDDDDDDEDEDDDDDDEDEEDERPRRRSVFASRRNDDDDDDEDEDDDDDDEDDEPVVAPKRTPAAGNLPAGAKVVGHTSDGREIIRMADGRQVVRATSSQAGQKIIGRTADGRDIIQLPDGRKVVRTPRVKKPEE